MEAYSIDRLVYELQITNKIMSLIFITMVIIAITAIVSLITYIKKNKNNS